MNGTLATSEVTIRQEPIQYRGPFEGIFNGMVLNAGWPVSTRTDRRYRRSRGSRIACNVPREVREDKEEKERKNITRKIGARDSRACNAQYSRCVPTYVRCYTNIYYYDST